MHGLIDGWDLEAEVHEREELGFGGVAGLAFRGFADLALEEVDD